MMPERIWMNDFGTFVVDSGMSRRSCLSVTVLLQGDSAQMSHGVAEVREVLYEGFAVGILERNINQPQWGHDDWIYAGAGAAGQSHLLRAAQVLQ